MTVYSIGDKIVHPMHGAGVIDGIEMRDISGAEMKYYILRMPIGNVTVMIPLDTCDTIGIRPIINAEEAEEVILEFRNLEVEDVANWNRRYRENMDRIKSGDLQEVCRVVKSLMVREERKPLSTGERKMLTTAKQILVSELVLATQRTTEEVEELLKKAIAEQ